MQLYNCFLRFFHCFDFFFFSYQWNCQISLRVMSSHRKPSGWKRWESLAVLESLSMTSVAWVCVTIPKTWPVLCFSPGDGHCCQGTPCLWKASGDSALRAWTPLLGIRLTFALCCIFAWIRCPAKRFLSLSVSSSPSSTWDDNTCDTRKGGIREVLNSWNKALSFPPIKPSSKESNSWIQPSRHGLDSTHSRVESKSTGVLLRVMAPFSKALIHNRNWGQWLEKN